MCAQVHCGLLRGLLLTAQTHCVKSCQAVRRNKWPTCHVPPKNKTQWWLYSPQYTSSTPYEDTGLFLTTDWLYATCQTRCLHRSFTWFVPCASDYRRKSVKIQLSEVCERREGRSTPTRLSPPIWILAVAEGVDEGREKGSADPSSHSQRCLGQPLPCARLRTPKRGELHCLSFSSVSAILVLYFSVFLGRKRD